MNAGAPTISLKIDVDTLSGYTEGIPRLLEVLCRLRVPATFCIAMGPDRSGAAVRRIFTKRGFLAKMLRTKAATTYGLSTLLYGTLLPAPLIVERRPAPLRELLTRGYEVIPHGWDHVNWHDYLARWDLERTRRELRLACEALERHTGHRCCAFASPGWQWTQHSAVAEEELSLVYAADTRGWAPFFPEVGGRASSVLQIPTTLPTLDELIGRRDLRGEDLLEYLRTLCLRPPSLIEDLHPPQQEPVHVFTAHAEVEGKRWLAFFEDLLGTLRAEGFRFVSLAQVARETLAEGNVPVCAVVDGELPGRAGKVACQDTPLRHT